MNRIIAIAVAAATLPFLALGMFDNRASAQKSDAEAVKAAVYAFFAAVSSRDISRMEALWAHDNNVAVVNVRDKAPSIGWNAGRKNWEAVFDFFSEVNPKPAEPHVQFIQGTALTATVVTLQGKTKAGQPISFTILASQAYVNRGDRWLAVAHHAHRTPD
jgi:ketosteroid isomerase-like protein